MTDNNTNPPKGSPRVTRRAVLIAGAVTLAVVLVAGGIAAIVLAGRAPAPVAAPTDSSGGSPSASSSVAATGGALVATTTATTVTDTPKGGQSGGDTTQAPKAQRPSKVVLDSLKSGEWRLYGAKVVSAGSELKGDGSTDIQGISMACEALTPSGKGFAHASVELAYSATGPASGKGGPWRLFGQWVLIPDSGTSDSQHFGQGVEGGFTGRSTVRPPAEGGKIVAGFRPIGAYRPKTAGGVIQGGRFNGDAMFEGVLLLPSVAVPPPNKK